MNRTDLQNAAMHKYFSLLADALNSAGYDMKKTLKEDIEIPWTMEMVKDHLWRPIQKVVTGKESTAALTSGEPSKVYDVLDRHLSSKLGIHIEFPKDERK